MVFLQSVYVEDFIFHIHTQNTVLCVGKKNLIVHNVYVWTVFSARGTQNTKIFAKPYFFTRYCWTVVPKYGGDLTRLTVAPDTPHCKTETWFIHFVVYSFSWALAAWCFCKVGMWRILYSIYPRKTPCCASAKTDCTQRICMNRVFRTWNTKYKNLC